MKKYKEKHIRKGVLFGVTTHFEKLAAVWRENLSCGILAYVNFVVAIISKTWCA